MQLLFSYACHIGELQGHLDIWSRLMLTLWLITGSQEGDVFLGSYAQRLLKPFTVSPGFTPKVWLLGEDHWTFSDQGFYKDYTHRHPVSTVRILDVTEVCRHST